MPYVAAADRYDHMQYRRCGVSGLALPAISLGFWHNFGGDRPIETGRQIVRRAFDLGVTHFDFANNYGPPYGSAEENFGRLLREDLSPYRDELVISKKGGYGLLPGPYGAGGPRGRHAGSHRGGGWWGTRSGNGPGTGRPRIVSGTVSRWAGVRVQCFRRRAIMARARLCQ